MHSGVVAAALAVAAFVQGAASDWRHVASAPGGANAAFIDRASIRANAAGNLEAAMFSLLARAVESTAAARFVVEFDCAAGRSRLVQAESFDADHQSGGMHPLGTEWETNPGGTQGDTILRFVCSRGASQPEKASLGSALPWEKGRAFLK